MCDQPSLHKPVREKKTLSRNKKLFPELYTEGSSLNNGDFYNVNWNRFLTWSYAQ